MLNIKFKTGTLKLMIERLIAAYNGEVDPSQHLSLESQGTGDIIEITQEEIFDTKDLYVCVYDDNLVGIFERKYVKGRALYYDYAVYTSLFSQQLGIESIALSYTSGYIEETYWKCKGFICCGYTATYTATCNITKAVRYDKVRLDMCIKVISSCYGSSSVTSCEMPERIEYGSVPTTSKEILEVLKYAPEYLGLTQEDPNKTKQKF